MVNSGSGSICACTGTNGLKLKVLNAWVTKRFPTPCIDVFTNWRGLESFVDLRGARYSSIITKQGGTYEVKLSFDSRRKYASIISSVLSTQSGEERTASLSQA